MRRALGEYRITGIRTNLAFHRRLVEHPDFCAGRYDTGFIAEHEGFLTQGSSATDDAALAAALAVATMTSESRSRSKKAPSGAAPGPWLASHRASLLRRS